MQKRNLSINLKITQAKLEELKRKIDANAKKAGITKDADAPERLLKVSNLFLSFFLKKKKNSN